MKKWAGYTNMIHEFFSHLSEILLIMSSTKENDHILSYHETTLLFIMSDIASATNLIHRNMAYSDAGMSIPNWPPNSVC